MTIPAKTFSDTLSALSDHPDLSLRTKADLASGVRVFCRVLGLDPAMTPAGDLAALQDLLATTMPERSSLTPARWSVVRSQVLRALEVTGTAKPLRTATVPLSMAWARLLETIPMKGQRLVLSRLARFCSLEGVAPGEVDKDTFARFGEALAAGSLVRNPGKVCRDAAQAWSGLPEVIVGSPTRAFAPVPNRKLKKSGRHPLAAFPRSFQNDLERFKRWCTSADPLDDRCRPKPLRAQTVISYTSNLHTATDAAVRSGVPIADVTSIAVLADPAIYLRILRQMLADADNKATANVHGVATVVLIVALDWLRQSPEQIDALKRLKAKLPKLRPGLTQKNRDLLASFDDKALLDRFLRLGDVLWREALSEKRPRNQRLVSAQTSLLIGILQVVPLRRKNICAMKFDTNITSPNGANAEALIQVPAEDMKTEVDFVGELPLELSRRLHHYRTKLAPALTGKVPSHLFIRIDGKPKRQESVTNRLELTLKSRLGIPMTMHQFRHLAAKLMLDANPGAFEAVAQLLGHVGTKNAIKFYGGTDTRRATRHQAALIERLGAEAKQRRSRRRKT